MGKIDQIALVGRPLPASFIVQAVGSQKDRYYDKQLDLCIWKIRGKK